MELVSAEVPLARQSSISAHYKPVKPPTLTMVLEAVKFLNENKGSSAIAIRRYILHNYPGVDPIRLKYHLKQALAKGLDKGYLMRPPNSSAQGVTGRFKLVKPKQDKGKDEESSDGETASKPAKKKVAAVRKPRSKAPAEKQRSKTDPEKGKKKPKIVRSKTEDGNNSSKIPAKPKEKTSTGEAAKAAKKQRAPKAPQAKPASEPKKTTSKTQVVAKGSATPKAGEGAKPPPAEKAKAATGAAKTAKTKSVSDKAKAGSGTKTKRKKPEAKKEVARGEEEEEGAAAVPDV